MSNSTDEPAVLAHQCYLNRDYSGALHHLNILEGLVSNNSALLKRVQHNKAVVEFAASEMKNIGKFKKSLHQFTGCPFPEIEVKDYTKPCLLYNYAVVLYHSRYYYQCTVLLEKLLMNKNIIKDTKLLHAIILLLLEATLCRRTYEKTLEIAKDHGELLKNNNDVCELFERLVSRAQLYLGQKINLKPDSIENIFILAQQKYMNGEIHEASDTLGQYRSMEFSYNLKTHGEDIWAATNNNLGLIFLSIKKPFLASKYFQNAVKEHFKSMESEDSEMLITCKDRPLYIFNLGLALLASKNCDGAFECLVEAARHYPNNPRIWLRLAECCVNKCCSEEMQQFTIKRLGSGSHMRILLSKGKEKYSASGESFAIPSLSLEFAVLCLRNAISLLCDQETLNETATSVIQAPPGPPIDWKQRCELRNQIFVLQSYIFLLLQDPLSAHVSAKELLGQTDATNEQKAWAHIYAAEALITLDKIVDAVEHLHPPMIHDLVNGLPLHLRDMIEVSVWAKAAVCRILRGDLAMARKILMQINSPRVLPLQMYLEICTGNIENCQTIMRKIRISNTS